MQQIDDAVDLIDSSISANCDSVSLKDEDDSISEIVDAQSLLERCGEVCDRFIDKKPDVRIIHHLACSGGTLISKCLSAMPNVCLLSEVHPFSNRGISLNKPKFSPTDLPSLIKYSELPNQEKTLKRIFQKTVDVVVDETEKNGMNLILRYHSHSDFHSGKIQSTKKILDETLSQLFNVKSVYTIRDPIDSYASLKENGWVHFTPSSFDEYCRRYLLFLKEVNNSQVVRYEDFITNPESVMRRICEILNLTFYSDFELMYDFIKLTGDSGRHSNAIKKRKRNANTDLLEDAKESNNYKLICEQYGYLGPNE
jgi:hypothetical protein